MRASNTELRSTIVELRQSIEQTTKQSTETIDQLQKELIALNESMQEVESQLVSKKSRTVPPNPPTVALSAMINHDNNTTVSTQQPTTTTTALITSKPNIKASPPEPFSGEKIRLVGDWLAAVRRYLSLSGVEETKWVAYAVTMLTSIALSWWNSVESSNPDRSTLDYSWIEFTVLVKFGYGVKDMLNWVLMDDHHKADSPAIPFCYSIELFDKTHCQHATKTQSLKC